MQVNKKSIAVIIPMYKSSINPNEKISLVQLLKVLSDYDILFVVPESLYFQPALLIPGNPSLETTGVIRFPDKWFSSTIEYSKLLVSREFYSAFDKYSYILLCQLDAYIFYDGLQDWASKGYDYIGAPWIHEEERIFFQSMYKVKLKILFSLMSLVNKVFF